MFETSFSPFATERLPPQSLVGGWLPLKAGAEPGAVPDPWWADQPEGQLAVDVFDRDEALVVVAALAGTKPEDIELHLYNDTLTIRGARAHPAPGFSHSYYQECFWGRFSRTIVLPAEVKAEFARAEYQNGVLVIHLPKAKNSTNIPLLVVDE